MYPLYLHVHQQETLGYEFAKSHVDSPMQFVRVFLVTVQCDEQLFSGHVCSDLVRKFENETAREKLLSFPELPPWYLIRTT